MEFLVSRFPKKMGSVSVDEKFVKVSVPSGGLFGKEVFENIPIKNISNAKISRKTNGLSLILGIFLMIIAGFGLLFTLTSVLTYISQRFLYLLVPGIPFMLLFILGYFLFINAKTVVITIEKSGLSTQIKAPNIESGTLNKIYELIFEGIKERI